MKSILIIIDYFGEKWPEWFPIYIESCRKNPSINWLFNTNIKYLPDFPCENISFRHFTIPEYESMVSKKLDIKFSADPTYKICDIKPAYGFLYENDIKGYDFWGFGDIDLIYGDLRKFLTEKILINNVVSTHIWCLSGHLCLFKNNHRNRNAFKKVKSWKKDFETSKIVRFDEDKFSKLFLYPSEYADIKWRKMLYNFLHPITYKYRKYVYLREMYTTPLIPNPWLNGQLKHPKIWYWQNGKITNSDDGDMQFIYLHFMNYKNARWMHKQYGKEAYWAKLSKYVHVNETKDIQKGIRIDEFGFHPLKDYSKSLDMWQPPNIKSKNNVGSVIALLSGGLGSQLFQYAYAYALSRRTKKKLFLDHRLFNSDEDTYQKDIFYLDKFNISGEKIPAQNLNFYIPSLTEAEDKNANLGGFVFEKSLEHYPEYFEKGEENYYLNGRFQSVEYFQEYSKDLLHELKLKYKPDSKNQKIADIISSTESVSIHIRSIDYKNINPENTQFIDYYKNALLEICKKVENPEFFVFSDKPEWAYKHFKPISSRIYYITNNLVNQCHNDLILMSLCKHNIISNSSLSWWGAWLNKNTNKQVIAPKKWSKIINQTNK